MADYQEFRRKSKRRRMKKRLLAGGILMLAAAVLAGTGWLAARGIQAVRAAGQEDVSVQVTAEPTQQENLPAVSGLLTPVTEDTNWDTVAYTARTLDYTVLSQNDGTTALDYRLAALPACGRITKEYYNYVTFMGDSLTQGLQLYTTGLPNAYYCAYRGIGPNAVVNGTLGRRTDGSKGVPLEDLAQQAPEAIYVLFGTNVLTNASDSAQASFLAYYDQMIDMIREVRPGIRIYMQTITPVRPEVAAEKPGLNRERLQRINDELAAMALNKGCYFIDLWEPLADAAGDLRAEYAAGDGIHMNPTGYSAWVEYLLTHTAYKSGALYEPGSGSWYIPA